MGTRGRASGVGKMRLMAPAGLLATHVFSCQRPLRSIGRRPIILGIGIVRRDMGGDNDARLRPRRGSTTKDSKEHEGYIYHEFTAERLLRRPRQPVTQASCLHQKKLGRPVTQASCLHPSSAHKPASAPPTPSPAIVSPGAQWSLRRGGRSPWTGPPRPWKFDRPHPPNSRLLAGG